MCSIFKYKNIIGRNFDYEVSYSEEFRIIEKEEYNNKFKIMGMCTGFVKDYPLFYDAMNEHGLCMGGLAFSGTAVYNDEIQDKHNIPSYAFILSILGNFKSVKDAKEFIENVNITNEPYSDEMPPSDLHWFIADKDESLIIEQTRFGLNMYGGEVMTNNPIFSIMQTQNKISEKNVGIEHLNYSTRGMESWNLAGGYTSAERFERLSWLKNKLELSENNFNDISQAFHLLASIEQIYGITAVNDKFEYTIYSIVYDMNEKKVYLKTYDDLECKRVDRYEKENNE